MDYVIDFFALWLASDVPSTELQVNYDMTTFSDTLRDGSSFSKFISLMEHLPLKCMLNICFTQTQIVSNTRALRCSFSPEVKKSQSNLHWDCIPFFVKCNQSDNQFTQTKPQNAEQNERSQIKEQKMT